jgi:lipoyl-dependent peroxiredoxin
MSKIDKVLYTGRTHTISGRDGSAHSDDGRLQIKLSRPGSTGPGTNPEQLFAAGWSACFLGAMGRAAQKMGLGMPQDASVDAEVDLGTGGDEFFLQARLSVNIPGVDRDTAQALADAAHQICPYSKATRGNIDVQITVAQA